MIERPHQKLDLLLVLHAIGILSALRVPPDDQFVLEVVKDVVGKLGDMRGLLHPQSLQRGVIEAEDEGQRPAYETELLMVDFVGVVLLHAVPAALGLGLIVQLVVGV